MSGSDNNSGSRAKRKLERELRLGMMTSRRAMVDRDKAMEAARNPGVSKFGDCLVNINSKADKMLNSQLKKIRSEIRQMEMQISQKKKFFLKNSGVLNHDPLILVERPASPDVFKRAHVLSSLGDKEEPPPLDATKVPGYMKPLRSRARTPSTLTTIDAFTVKTRKKKNIWEEAMDGKAVPVFKSTVRPTAKLTRREESDLQMGYSYHKPRLTPDTGLTADNEDSDHRKFCHPENDQTGSEDSDLEDDLTPFITQMANVRTKKHTNHKHNNIGLVPEIRESTSPSFQHQLRATDLPKPKSRSSLRVSQKNVRFSSPVAPSPLLMNRKKALRATSVAY